MRSTFPFQLLVGVAGAVAAAAVAHADDGVFADRAMAAARAAPPAASCVLQEWEAALAGRKGEAIEVWRVQAHERFLACYRTAEAHGTVGEIGVDTEKRRVPSGTRFTATVRCQAGEPTCTVTWAEPECCYDLDHNRY